MTKDEAARVATMVGAVVDAIKELGEMPSGTLYATLMPMGCSIEAFEKLIALVKQTGRVEEKGNLLRYIGKKVPA